jgi:hypothetical protein
MSRWKLLDEIFEDIAIFRWVGAIVLAPLWIPFICLMFLYFHTYCPFVALLVWIRYKDVVNYKECYNTALNNIKCITFLWSVPKLVKRRRQEKT